MKIDLNGEFDVAASPSHAYGFLTDEAMNTPGMMLGSRPRLP